MYTSVRNTLIHAGSSTYALQGEKKVNKKAETTRQSIFRKFSDSKDHNNYIHILRI